MTGGGQEKTQESEYTMPEADLKNDTQSATRRWIGVVAVLACLFLLAAWYVLPEFAGERSYRRVSCLQNLRVLAVATHLYRKDHDGNLNPEYWCDAVAEYVPHNADVFICPVVKQGRCHYALNPRCKSDSPVDTVLLFESDAGWNAHGGPGLLSFKHHTRQGKPSANILLNDGTVRAIHPEDVNDLNWGDPNE